MYVHVFHNLLHFVPHLYAQTISTDKKGNATS